MSKHLRIILAFSVLVFVMLLGKFFIYDAIPKKISEYSHDGKNFSIYQWREAGFDYAIEFRVTQDSKTASARIESEYQMSQSTDVDWTISSSDKNILICTVGELAFTYDIRKTIVARENGKQRQQLFVIRNNY